MRAHFYCSVEGHIICVCIMQLKKYRVLGIPIMIGEIVKSATRVAPFASTFQ